MTGGWAIARRDGRFMDRNSNVNTSPVVWCVVWNWCVEMCPKARTYRTPTGTALSLSNNTNKENHSNSQ